MGMGIPISDIRKQQNFPLAIVAGLLAAVMGAGMWTGVAIVTEHKLGYVALLVGFIVGKAISFTGRGIDQKFGILGALCGLLGCVLGDVSSDIAFYARTYHLSYSYVIEHLDANFLAALAQAAYKPMDLVFYAIAVYEGYRYSFKYRRIHKAA
jgi:hypothetical protein